VGRHAPVPSSARWPRPDAAAALAEFLRRAARLEVDGCRVVRAAVFGSYVTEPDSPELGDLDLLVEFEPPDADGAGLREALAAGLPVLALHRWDLDAQTEGFFPRLPPEAAFRLAVQLVRGLAVFPP
jgi:hypothetical protein